MPSLVSPPKAPAAGPSPDGARPAAPPAAATRDARTSALLGWAALILVVVAGVPTFLCMPVWFDTYHYDICIRTLLRGGVLYRDVFDNNLPGIIWLQGAVRLLVGWRTDAIRLVDLVFFTGGVLLLLRWVPRGARVWTAVAYYAFYLFVPESCPCERDIWMLWPAVVALTLRRAQVRRLGLGAPGVPSVVGLAALEGVCWGAGVWIKPFVFVPGLACWLVSVVQLRRAAPGKARLLVADAAGLLAGGALLGALGLLWLWRSGCWSYFWDILVNWNKDYATFADRVRFWSCAEFMVRYLPWSAALAAAVWIALAALKREIADAPAGAPQAPWPGHALLAAFFLAWLFQAVFLQLPHDYPVVAALIPGIALIAAHWRWRPSDSLVAAAARLSLFALAALLWVAAFRLDRLAYWAECCREGGTPHVQSLLATRKDSAYCPDPEPLAAVAGYLRSQGAGDGEVTCMSGCTHPLYLDLDLKPSTRFNQVEMAAMFFTRRRQEILDEVNASRQRFIVSDLAWTDMTGQDATEVDPADPLALPPAFPDKFALAYPWREPIVFRCGRYLVHRVTGPATPFWRTSIERSNAKNDYAQEFAGRQSFRDEAAARATVGALEELYRRSEAAPDAGGRYEALRRGLELMDRAQAAGREREADIFRRWIEGRLNEEAAADRP